MPKLYLMPSGSIAVQASKPVLMTENQFLECCCDLDCPTTLYIRVCCVEGVFSPFSGVHTLERDVLTDFWYKEILSSDNFRRIEVRKHATWGWVVQMRVLMHDGSNCACAGSPITYTRLTLGRGTVSTAECPPYDANYTLRKECVLCSNCTDATTGLESCDGSTDAYAVLSDVWSTVNGHTCTCGDDCLNAEVNLDDGVWWFFEFGEEYYNEETGWCNIEKAGGLKKGTPADTGNNWWLDNHEYYDCPCWSLVEYDVGTDYCYVHASGAVAGDGTLTGMPSSLYVNNPSGFTFVNLDIFLHSCDITNICTGEMDI